MFIWICQKPHFRFKLNKVYYNYEKYFFVELKKLFSYLSGPFYLHQEKKHLFLYSKLLQAAKLSAASVSFHVA